MSDNQPSTPDPSGVQRTETGEIKSQTQTTPAAATPQTSTTTEKPSLVNQDDRSLANQTPPSPGPGAPEAYATWTTPEGFEIDSAVDGEAKTLFKAMNISQADGQRLVDFYVKHTTASQNAPYEAWNQMQENWVKEVKADPQIGPRLDEVKTTISRAIDGLNDPTLASQFREAMDYTGAGNNPAFIRTFYKLAQMVTEGKHIAGNGPSPAGQQGRQERMSAAGAMYPNLPRA
jgi:hypothetical protein